MTSSEISIFNKLSNREAPKMTLADAMREARRDPSEAGSQPPPTDVSYGGSHLPKHEEGQLYTVTESSPAHPSPAAGSPVTIKDHVSTDAEKHATLLEIERLRQAGAATTRSWSMRDSLEDMQLEERKLTSNLDEAQMVNTMRAGLELMFTGIELANNRFGFLELEGWSAQMTADMTRYDAALTKLYRRHWRRSTTSPEMEILLTIATSIVTHHVKTKFTKATLGKATDGSATTRARSPMGGATTGAPAAAADSHDEDYYGSAANHFEDDVSSDSDSGDEGPPPVAT